MNLGDLDRYGWVHELVDDRPAVRARALARHRRLLGRARHHGHGGARSGTLADPVRAFTSLVPPSWSSTPGTHDPEGYVRLAPYGLLFLQWEQRFPEEWRPAGWPFSLWSEKEAVLHAFCADEPTPLTRPALEDLLTGMDSRAASAVLRAMSPAMAGQRLGEVTSGAAAALLQPTDPAFTASVLARMSWWRAKHILLAMSPDTAAPLLARLRRDPVTGKRRDLELGPP